MFPLFSLNEWWQVLGPAQQVFWVIALLFSVFFVMMFGLSLVGLNGDTDVDTDLDTDMDTGHGSSHDFNLDKDFSAFSIRSIIAFFTFFGWTGVYFLSQGNSVWFTILISVLSGSAAMFVVAYMIYKFAQMEKSGTVDVLNALDQTGEVYLSIPQNLQGKGKVHIVVDGSLHEFDAETKGQLLSTGSQVRVVEILENEVLLVEPIILELER